MHSADNPRSHGLNGSITFQPNIPALTERLELPIYVSKLGFLSDPVSGVRANLGTSIAAGAKSPAPRHAAIPGGLAHVIASPIDDCGNAANGSRQSLGGWPSLSSNFTPLLRMEEAGVQVCPEVGEAVYPVVVVQVCPEAGEPVYPVVAVRGYSSEGAVVELVYLSVAVSGSPWEAAWACPSGEAPVCPWPRGLTSAAMACWTVG